MRDTFNLLNKECINEANYDLEPNQVINDVSRTVKNALARVKKN